MTKALFFDIDGTLVSFQTHKVAESTIEAIKKAKEKGVKIFVATGRPAPIIDNLSQLQDEGLIDGYVTINGGQCEVEGKMIYSSALPKEEVKRILDYCAERNIPSVILGDGKIAVCRNNKMVEDLFRNFLKVTTHIAEVTEEEVLTWGEVNQITPFISVEQEKELDLKESESSRWIDFFTDITAKGNNKSKGIDKMIQHFGIDIKETMAFGDGGNDVSMLIHAGIGIAMGNAKEDVQKVADYVTTTVDEDGIANGLKHYGIID